MKRGLFKPETRLIRRIKKITSPYLQGLGVLLVQEDNPSPLSGQEGDRAWLHAEQAVRCRGPKGTLFSRSRAEAAGVGSFQRSAARILDSRTTGSNQTLLPVAPFSLLGVSLIGFPISVLQGHAELCHSGEKLLGWVLLPMAGAESSLVSGRPSPKQTAASHVLSPLRAFQHGCSRAERWPRLKFLKSLRSEQPLCDTGQLLPVPSPFLSLSLWYFRPTSPWPHDVQASNFVHIKMLIFLN